MFKTISRSLLEWIKTIERRNCSSANIKFSSIIWVYFSFDSQNNSFYSIHDIWTWQWTPALEMEIWIWNTRFKSASLGMTRARHVAVRNLGHEGIQKATTPKMTSLLEIKLPEIVLAQFGPLWRLKPVGDAAPEILPEKHLKLACLNFSFNWFQRWNLMIFSFACNSALSHYSKVNSWKAFLSRTPSILVLCASYVRSLAQLS
jgi:hypothetical protein